MTLLSLEVLNDRRGKPFARARKELASYVEALQLVAHVSLSDEADHVMAFVVLEQRGGRSDVSLAGAP
jgi:holo-[acyl-carrier protein] synthase